MENRHGDSLRKCQLTHTEDKMKKGDDVADDEDDDGVGTSMSQEQVTVTLCTEELFLSTRFIYIQ
jgi:hypothetical protein